MLYRGLIICCILSLLNLSAGCAVYTKEMTLLPDKEPPSDQPPKPMQKSITEQAIAEVVLLDGSTVTFNDDGARYAIPDSSVIGLDTRGKIHTVHQRDILYVRVMKPDAGGTVLSTAGVLVAIAGGLVIILAASSCPFVYSFDGTHYVFDAEPLGGAIARGLAKTDWSRLEMLKEHKGYYDLLIRNELDETQHLDELRLLVADHPPGSLVYPDLEGTLHALRGIVPPASARDENGRDILPFVSRPDNITWQTAMPSGLDEIAEECRHDLRFTFPRPAGAQRVGLVVNAGTASWGSEMIRRMLMLRGDRLGAWYADIDAGGVEKLKLGAFVLREELFILKVYVREQGAWVHRGYIPGSGPYMTEDRVCFLDISKATGDSLEIRLQPPAGYWAINHLAASFDAPATVESRLLTAEELRDQDGADIAPLLSLQDGRFHDMPVTGMQFTARFPVPEIHAGLQRSVFLQTSGWYELHLPQDTAEKTALIHTLMTVPGRIARYSIEEFIEWRNRHASIPR